MAMAHKCTTELMEVIEYLRSLVTEIRSSYVDDKTMRRRKILSEELKTLITVLSKCAEIRKMRRQSFDILVHIDKCYDFGEESITELSKKAHLDKYIHLFNKNKIKCAIDLVGVNLSDLFQPYMALASFNRLSAMVTEIEDVIGHVKHKWTDDVIVITECCQKCSSDISQIIRTTIKSLSDVNQFQDVQDSTDSVWTWTWLNKKRLQASSAVCNVVLSAAGYGNTHNPNTGSRQDANHDNDNDDDVPQPTRHYAEDSQSEDKTMKACGKLSKWESSKQEQLENWKDVLIQLREILLTVIARQYSGNKCDIDSKTENAKAIINQYMEDFDFLDEQITKLSWSR